MTPAQSSAAPDVAAHKADAGSLPLGVTWDAYSDSAHCKLTEEIASDFSRMKGYKIIRIYGTDCDQVPLAVQNALKNGQKLMGGAYIQSNDMNELTSAIDQYKNAIDEYAGGRWDVFSLFSV